MKEKVPREMWCMFLVYKSFSCCHLLDRSENILRVAMLNVLKSLLDLIHLDEWPQMSVMSTQKGLPKGNKQQMRIIKLNWHFRIKGSVFIISLKHGLRLVPILRKRFDQIFWFFWQCYLELKIKLTVFLFFWICTFL